MFSGITYQPTNTYQVYSSCENNQVVSAIELANMVFREFEHWIHHPEENAVGMLRVQPEPCMQASLPITYELNRDRLISMFNQLQYKGDVRLVFDASRLILHLSKRKVGDSHPESPFNRYWTAFSVHLQQELHNITMAGNHVTDTRVGDIYVCAKPNDLLTGFCTRKTCTGKTYTEQICTEIMVDIAIPWHLIRTDRSIRFECEPSELSMVATCMYVIMKPEVQAVIRDRLSRFGKIWLNEAFQDTGVTVAPFRISSQYIAEFIVQQLETRLSVYVGFTCKNEIYLQTMSTTMI